MSSVRNRYRGPTFSCEFTCVMPADAHNVPRPASPRCFAPQGTASIFSRMPFPTSFLFLLSFADNGIAQVRVRKRMSELLAFMIASYIRVLAEQIRRIGELKPANGKALRLTSPLCEQHTHYCFGFGFCGCSGLSAVPVDEPVVPVPLPFPAVPEVVPLLL